MPIASLLLAASTAESSAPLDPVDLSNQPPFLACSACLFGHWHSTLTSLWLANFCCNQTEEERYNKSMDGGEKKHSAYSTPRIDLTIQPTESNLYVWRTCLLADQDLMNVSADKKILRRTGLAYYSTTVVARCW